MPSISFSPGEARRCTYCVAITSFLYNLDGWPDLCATADGKQLLTGASIRLRTYDTNSGFGTPGRSSANVCPCCAIHEHSHIPLTCPIKFATFTCFSTLQDVFTVAHAPKSRLTASGDAGGQVLQCWSCCMRFKLQTHISTQGVQLQRTEGNMLCWASVPAVLSGHCVEQQQPDCVDIPARAASHCTGFQQLCGPAGQRHISGICSVVPWRLPCHQAKGRFAQSPNMGSASCI